jgi:3-phenylpropionate/cinnamic acid dioxygenase small subunit
VTDVDEIRRTLALYSRFNDEKDSTAWSHLWTESGAVTDRSGTYVGRPAIKQFVDGINANNPERDTLHFCANSVIGIHGDTAQAHTDIVFVSRPTNPMGSWTVGNINHYTDHLVRSGSTWLFQDRRIDRRPSIRTPLADLSLGDPPDDEEAIRRALALYAQMADNKDPIGWSEQFATSGVFRTHAQEYVGRQAIKQFIQQQLADEATDRNTLHLGANVAIAVDGDSADVTSDWLVLENTGNAPWSVVHVGRAHDRLVREDLTWRFASKEE